MKKLWILFAVAITACSSQKNETPALPAGMHSIVAEEVLQSAQYTYVKGKDNDKSIWLASPAMAITSGQTLYYKDGLTMTNFQSKELNRSFEEVIFVDNLSTSMDVAEKGQEVKAPSELEQTLAKTGEPGTGDKVNSDAGANTNHSILAEEVLQTNQYTYIRGKEGNDSYWIAVNKMDAKKGENYSFTGGLTMNNFTSKELNRTFPEILFVDNISSMKTGADQPVAATVQPQSNPVSTGSAIPLEKVDVKQVHSAGDITIAAIYKDKQSYSGKTIKIKGQVTKFTPGIMKRNWIHLQDGTDYSGKFDLTVTTTQELQIGDMITAEGTINIDKDFGYGYFYDVIMEGAKIVK